MSVLIRKARPGEGERLREIAVASKSHWGYDEKQVRAWAAQGDFSPDALIDKEVFVAEVDGQAVGFAALIPQGEVCVVDDLWLEPAWIARGLGTQLFETCAVSARELGASRLEWEAEPNAVGFYEKVGGRYLRQSEQTPFGRAIPVMGLELK